MEVILQKGGEQRVVRSPEELQAALRDGWRRAVRDVNPFGEERVRSATEEETQGLVSSGQLVDAAQAAPEIASNRRREEIGIEAGAPGEQVFAGVSRFANSTLPGLGDALGLDAASSLQDDPEAQAIYRDRTSTVEGVADLAAVFNPLGAEAMVARGLNGLYRGASWARRAGLGAAEGAVGGALFSASEAATEGDLTDLEERLGSDMGVGALFGGAMGTGSAAFRAMRGRLRRGGNPLRQEIGSVATESIPTGELTPSGLPRGYDADSVAGRLSETTTSSTNSLGVNTRHVATQEAADRFANRGLAEHQHVVGGISEVVDTARAMRRELADLSTLPSVADDLAGGLQAGVREVRDGIVGPSAARLGVGVSNPVQSTMESALQSVSRAGPQERAQALFQAAHELDGIHRSALGEGSEGLQSLALEASQGLRGVIGEIDPSGEMLRRLEQMDKLRDYQRRLGTYVGDNPSLMNLLDEGVTADAAAIRGIIDHAGSAASSNVPKLENLEALLDMTGYVRATDNILPAGVNRPNNLEAIEASLRDTIRDAHAHSALETALGREGRAGGGPLAMGQAVSPGLAGAIAGGPVGAAIGFGMGIAGAYMRKPVGTHRAINRLRLRFGQQTNRLERAVSTNVRALASKANAPFSRSISPQAGTVGAILVNGTAEEKREAYMALSARVEDLANDPSTMAALAEEETRFADVLDPSLPGHMAMGMMRRVGAMASALPRTRRSSGMRILTPPPMPSMTEVSEFLQVAATVEDPIFGVELMSTGRMSQAAARAMAQSYPRFHQQVTAAYMSEMAEMSRRGERVNYQAALQVSRFAGFPLDDTMSPSFQAAMSDQSAQTTEQENAQFSRPVSAREPTSVRNETTVIERMQR